MSPGTPSEFDKSPRHDLSFPRDEMSHEFAGLRADIAEFRLEFADFSRRFNKALDDICRIGAALTLIFLAQPVACLWFTARLD